MVEKFTSRRQVFEYLKAKGYKVSQPKIYQDTQKGLLILEPDGSVRAESVERYIQLAQLPQPARQTVEAAARGDQKTAEEIKQLRLKNEKLECELAVMQGRFIEKATADANLADLAALLDALPRHILRMNLARYLSAAGGDPTRARIFFELFDSDFTAAVNRICDDGHADVIGEPNDGTDEAISEIIGA